MYKIYKIIFKISNKILIHLKNNNFNNNYNHLLKECKHNFKNKITMINFKISKNNHKKWKWI